MGGVCGNRLGDDHDRLTESLEPDCSDLLGDNDGVTSPSPPPARRSNCGLGMEPDFVLPLLMLVGRRGRVSKRVT